MGLGSIALLLVLVPHVARAGTATITGSASGATTRVPNIAAPGVQNTTFNTAAVGPFNFASYPFWVGSSGVYSATSSTPTYQNTTFFLTGLFTPSSTGTPATALSNYLISVYSGSAGAPNHTATFNSLSLTAGQQYTVLVAYNQNDPNFRGASTVTIVGVGCISFGPTNGCQPKFVPVADATSNGAAYVLDHMSNGSAGMNAAIAALSTLDSGQRGAALAKLVPVSSNAVQLASVASASGAFDRVGARLDGLRLAGGSFSGASLAASGGVGTGLSAGDEPAKNGAWLKGYGLKGKQGEKDGYAGYNSDGWGVIAGADREFSPGLIGGVALSYSDTSVAYNDQLSGDSSGVTSTQLSLYGSKNFGVYYVDAMLAYARQRNESRRDTVVNGYASGNYGGDQWAARIGTGVPIALTRDTRLTPQLRLEWNQVNQDGYRETGGGALALDVAANSAIRVRSGLGAQLDHDMTLGGIKTQPYVSLFWNHDFKNDGVNSDANFAGGGSTFMTPGQKLDSNTYALGVGVNLFTKDDFTASVGYYLNKGDSYTGQLAQATARWMF